MEYRYCYDELAQTPSYWVTVDLSDWHPDSPNIYVNDRANMLWLDILRAREYDHIVFNALINADSGGLRDSVYNTRLYNRLIIGSPCIDRVTVSPDSESDSDAENNGAENERASIVRTIDV